MEIEKMLLSKKLLGWFWYCFVVLPLSANSYRVNGKCDLFPKEYFEDPFRSYYNEPCWFVCLFVCLFKHIQIEYWPWILENILLALFSLWIIASIGVVCFPTFPSNYFLTSFNNGGRRRHICIRLAILHRTKQQRTSEGQFGGPSISKKAVFLSHTCDISVDPYSRSTACKGTDKQNKSKDRF